MRLTTQTLLTLSMALGAFAVFGTSASANVADDYRNDMYEFVPILRDWTAQIGQIADRAVAKPGDACSEEVVDLARRGAGMARDLDGMMAPNALAEAHDDLTAAFFSIASSAANGCSLGGQLASDIEAELADATDALRKIGYFAQTAPGIPIELPVPPVTGN